MKVSEKAVLKDIKHHIESIPVLAHNIIIRAKKTKLIEVDESICREIIRLSQFIIKK